MPSLSRRRYVVRRLLLSLLVLLAVAVVASRGDDGYAVSACRWRPYTCGGVNISYPFYLAGDTKAVPDRAGESYCGYPGLAVRCDGGDKAVMLLGEDNYTVSVIDYANLTVSIADADAADAGGGCLSVDHNVTIPSGFPLAFPISVVDYLFFFAGCSFGPDPGSDDEPPRPPKPPGLKPITCGGADKAPDGESSFVVPRADVPPGPGDWDSACRQVFEVPVLKASIPPDAGDAAWRDGGYGEAIRAGFRLGWDRRSGACEQSGGMCGYNSTGGFLGCLCADGRMDDARCSEILADGSSWPLRIV